MEKIGTIELEILFLGVTNNGRFNENDIEESELKRLGVGKILDTLAALKDKKLISLDKDGSFRVTEIANMYLWEKKIPLWTRILRLLEIQPQSSDKISGILMEPINDVGQELENLRKNQLVLMSPIRKDGKLVKSFEILQEGKDYIAKIESEGIPENIKGMQQQEVEILELIEQIINDIKQSEIPEKSQEEIISKIYRIRDKLNV